MKIILKENQIWESTLKDGLNLKIIGSFEHFSISNKRDIRYACITNENTEATYKEVSLKSYIKRNCMILKNY